MDAIRKHANKLREQVAKQQQAVRKQFSGLSVSPGSDSSIIDEAEVQRHQQLEKLYISTKASKHFQREVVKGVEGYISTGSKQSEIATKLSEDCRKYATEGPPSAETLAQALHHVAASLHQMEEERDTLHRALGAQVAEPLRAMVVGAPLEDARQLCQRYSRLWHEAEAQATEVSRRQLKSKEAGGTVENTLKLQAAEAKLSELLISMSSLGKEAAAAMTAVEAQQQRLTLQRLISMVKSERVYHQKVAEILDQLCTQMGSERQSVEAVAPTATSPDAFMPPPSYEDVKANGADLSASDSIASATQRTLYFLAEVIESFEAEAPGELCLSVGDLVVVRQVSPTGWSEGECKGKSGWFPTAYVTRRERASASKVVDAGLAL